MMTGNKSTPTRSLRPDGTPEPDAAPRKTPTLSELQAQIAEARAALSQWEGTVGELRSGPPKPLDPHGMDSKGGWDEMRLKLAEASFVHRPDGWPSRDDKGSKGNC